MTPEKLTPGDEVRIIAPSESFLSAFSNKMRQNARKRLEELGLKVSFGKYVEEVDELKSATVEHRLEDLHNAFSDPDVKAVIPVTGGTTGSELLRRIDYELIKKNPTIICGLSDNTAILNAINDKSGIVTYYGPHFSVFGASEQGDYTMKFFEKCLFTTDPITLHPSDDFYSSEWQGKALKNDGFWSINDGEAHATAFGGNLLTLNLMEGSGFISDWEGKIFIMEDNGKESPAAFFNQLQSMINKPGFKNVAGMMIGRFQKKTGMTKELLKKVLNKRMRVDKIPIIANVDFGHTLPMVTIPIGGSVKLSVDGNKVKIEITEH
jgi:muramoyltetrapeptide carboxypeptidase